MNTNENGLQSTHTQSTLNSCCVQFNECLLNE